jgi:aspartate/methionine/tyrosine aminotransferase
MVTSGGIHGLYVVCQGLLEPGDEVLTPIRRPLGGGQVRSARRAGAARLYESRNWRPDVDEMARLVTPKTRAIYLNSPSNPTGGVLERSDLEAIAALAPRARSLDSLGRSTRTCSTATRTRASRRRRGCTSARFRCTHSARRTR